VPRPARFLALACALALAAPATAGAAREDDALDEGLRELVELRGGPPGAVAMVQRGRRPALHRAGVANVRTRARIRASDHMRIASVAKAFSGAVALRLVDRGTLTLDDTVGQRVPGTPPAWAPITLRQLLQHTSGLPDFTAERGFQRRLARDPKANITPRQDIAFVERKPLEFRPGSRYEYSNTDNIVVGLMVEAVTGGSYEDALEQLVFRPLGLSETSLPSGARLPRPYIHGYAPTPDGPEDISTVFSVSGAWASGGIQSTPADLNDFIRAYAGGRLFGAATTQQQLQLVKGSSDPPGPGRNDAGLAIFRYRTRCGTVHGHTGNIGGYTQFAAATPDGTRSVTVSVTTQLSETIQPRVLRRLRRVFELGVCAARAR
jgi:D-alanyl-D-alanine carboxypeptidase